MISVTAHSHCLAELHHRSHLKSIESSPPGVRGRIVRNAPADCQLHALRAGTQWSRVGKAPCPQGGSGLSHEPGSNRPFRLPSPTPPMPLPPSPSRDWPQVQNAAACMSNHKEMQPPWPGACDFPTTCQHCPGQECPAPCMPGVS